MSKYQTSNTILAAALTICAAASASHAQQSEPQSPHVDSAKLTLRVYNVRDLVMVVPDHQLDADKSDAKPASIPSGGRFSGGGGGFGGGAPGLPQSFFAAARKTEGPQAVEIGRLIEVITATVEPESWAESSGEGRIQSLGSSLVILQRPDVHELINQLLNELRDASGTRRTVSIDARWLLLSSDDLERLAKPADSGLLVVDRKILAEFTRQPGNLRAITNCFSGQQVYLTSGMRRNVVSGYIPVVGSIDLPTGRDALAPNSASVQLAQLGGEPGMEAAAARPIADKSVGYQPIVQTTNFGVQLEIRPTLQMDKTAVVDLKSTVTFPDEQTPSTAAAVDPNAVAGMFSPAPSVDRLSMNAMELATTMIVPLGQPVLVGGMTHLAGGQQPATVIGAAPPAAGPEAATPTDENLQLYLILELR